MKNLVSFVRICILLASLLALAIAGCQRQPALTMEKAKESFNVFFPDAVVKSVSPTEVKGIYEVVVSDRGNTGIIYMSPDGRHILTGLLLDVDAKEDITTERMLEATKVDFKSIPLTNSITMGAKDSTYKIVVFSDPNCEACALYHEELKKAVDINKQLSVYIKIIPLVDMSEEGFDRSRSVICTDSNEEALKSLESAYAGKKLPKPKCDGQTVKDNFNLARELRVARTPTTIFMNGHKMSEAMRASPLLAHVDKRSGITNSN